MVDLSQEKGNWGKYFFNVRLWAGWVFSVWFLFFPSLLFLINMKYYLFVLGLAPNCGWGWGEDSISEKTWLELRVKRAVRRTEGRRAVEITQ